MMYNQFEEKRTVNRTEGEKSFFMDNDNRPLKKIRLVATGGTIASKARTRVSTEGYNPSVITIEDLVNQLPELKDLVDLTAEQIFLKPSSSITDDDLFDLAARVNELLAGDDCDGVVITHGTDTMEETAFFLNLTVNSDKPVVITGSMRPNDVISADGPLNLFNAVLCAASDQSRGMGVVICMNDLIVAARDAVKFNTFKVETYQGPVYGNLGTVRNGKVTYVYKPLRRHTVTSQFAGKRLELPPAEILYMYQGCDDTLFRAALQKGVKGLVTAGSGNGGVIGSIMKAYRSDDEQEVAKLPILVRSTRVSTGGVSDSWKSGDRVIASGDLNPHKAYILLRFALAVTDDPAEIRTIFNEY